MSTHRHFGLDWLRIAAFALLIVYHVAMVFAPWDWVVKWPVTYPALVVPMALVTPWRLALLFVVSGFATRHLLARQPGIPAFLRARAKRLLIPLAFALIVLLPPELWVRVRETGYQFGLAHYWLRDYWSLVPVHGFAFPTWEHLWFVAYLATYTAALAALLAWRGTAPFDAAARCLAPGRRLLWAPAAVLVTAKLALMFVVPERQSILHDWGGHAEHFPLLLFGFALAGGRTLWPAIDRNWRAGAGLAAASALVVVWVELAYQGHHVPGHVVMAADRAARLTMAWGTIVTLLHVAERFWNHDHRWRAPLAEAVFPAYLVHHPVLVVLTWTILPLGLGALHGFVFLLSATAAACLVTYVLGRDIAWLRPLIGLAPVAKRRLAPA